jgi:hypothetical protein
MKKNILICIASFILIISIIFTITYFVDKYKKVKTNESNLQIVKIQAYIPGYQNIDDLASASSNIIIGVPENDILDDKTVTIYATSEKTNITQIADEYALRRIRVEEVIKGDIIDSYIMIAEGCAAVNSGKLFLTDDYYPSQKGMRYIFFLKSKRSDFYSIIAGIQGKYNIDGKDTLEKSMTETNNTSYIKMKTDVIEKYADIINKY